MNIGKILATLPILEVGIRQLYWRIPIVRTALALRKKKKKHTNIVDVGPRRLLSELREGLTNLGVGKDDVLIVHSSTTKLTQAGHSVDEILNELIEIVGPGGTLVMPIFSIFDEEPAPQERFDDLHYKDSFEFRKGEMQIWTGRLPQALSCRSEAVMSSVPLNTLAAFGAEASAIVGNKNVVSVLAPCGEFTPWAACLERNAKILMIDVPVAHNLTMIHAAEDLYPDEWPIPDWYRKRKFRVADGSVKTEITIKERRPKWALFYCEFRLNRDLVRDGIFERVKTQQGLQLALGESKALVEYLRSKRPSSYPYLIPSFFKKKL